jgi:hypothetical protein
MDERSGGLADLFRSFLEEFLHGQLIIANPADRGLACSAFFI